MKPLFTFILGALLMVAIGVFAQSNGITIFKPAVPTHVVVKDYNYFNPPHKDIVTLRGKGYLVRTLYQSSDKLILIYEKY